MAESVEYRLSHPRQTNDMASNNKQTNNKIYLGKITEIQVLCNFKFNVSYKCKSIMWQVKENLFYLTTHLEHIDFHIIGYW